ncbi:MAG: selenocysteine-specific translation elongation factor [Candidatus Eremiobacteraeota bacterium]|nr:selenocysteine-specific translation elongation factor [Candidatus Eremiobacteraeota bacterium]MCW5870259.1 selenocysteine-specific translation elongation factor [Candidatus Eremiobacteraeota bacterium]
MRKHFIVGTAGHVDHGKSSLIRALTGIETDRLPEEKARGLSIELGFAHLALPGDVVAGIVDVPGHERFLKNMLAGVGGYDLGLLVVDAQEGVMPQTREHVEILELLRTPQGMVAITKADLVEAEFLELVREELRDFLKGTLWGEAPMLPVSSKTGQGLDELRQQLGRLLGKSAVRDRKARFRLPIDRVFVKPGFGTVVTGSLWSGSLGKGTHMQLWPSGREVRVRGLHVHGQEVEEAVAGQRVAVNLSGVDSDEIKRGMLLASPDWLNPTRRCDVRLQISPRAPRALKHRSRVRVYHGTSEVFGRALLLEGEELTSSQSGLVQFALDEALVMLPGDRLILRDFTSSYTIGGAEVLEPLAQAHRRHDEEALLQLQKKEAGGLHQRLLAELQGSVSRTALQLAGPLQLPVAEVEQGLVQLQELDQAVWLGKAWAQTASLDEVREALLGLLAGLQQKSPWKSGWRKEELLKQLAHPQPRFAEECLNFLLEHGQVQLNGRLLSLPEHRPQLTRAQQQALEGLEQRLLQDAFTPPNWSDLAALQNLDPAMWKVLETFLLETGRAEKLAPDLGLLRPTLEQGKRKLAELPSPFTASQARDALKTSRKFVIPLLEYFDQVGFTQRQGEVRQLRF